MAESSDLAVPKSAHDHPTIGADIAAQLGEQLNPGRALSR